MRAAVRIPQKAREARCTLAREAVHSVHTSAGVATRLGAALIYICLAAHTTVTGLARTKEAVDLVAARTAVHTRLRTALIHVRLAEEPEKSSKSMMEVRFAEGKKRATTRTRACQKSRQHMCRQIRSLDPHTCHRYGKAPSCTHPHRFGNSPRSNRPHTGTDRRSADRRSCRRSYTARTDTR
jgi:hypothetical protein